MEKAKCFSKAHVLIVFFSKQNICASRRDRMPICKSKTSLSKARIIFSDSIVADGLEEGFTGFQLFKSAAPNSSMATSYEHSSV